MSLKDDIKILKYHLRPKATIKFVFDESEIVDEPGVIWVVFQI